MVSKGRDINNNGNKNYDPLEIMIIQQNLDRSDKEIQLILRESGFVRSINSIQVKKHKLGLRKEYNR